MSLSRLKVRNCVLDKDFTQKMGFFPCTLIVKSFHDIDIVWVKFKPNLSKGNGILLMTNEIGQRDG